MFWVLCENLRKRKKRKNFHSQLWAVGNFLREKSLSLCLLIKLSCWILINIQSICQRHRRININKCVDDVDRNVSRVRLMSMFDCCWCPIQSRERREIFQPRMGKKSPRKIVDFQFVFISSFFWLSSLPFMSSYLLNLLVFMLDFFFQNFICPHRQLFIDFRPPPIFPFIGSALLLIIRYHRRQTDEERKREKTSQFH